MIIFIYAFNNYIIFLNENVFFLQINHSLYFMYKNIEIKMVKYNLQDISINIFNEDIQILFYYILNISYNFFDYFYNYYIF